MSNVNFNPVRGGSQPLGAKTGPINVQELETLVSALPIADSNEVKGGAAAEQAELPALFGAFSARDQQALMQLPASVRQKLLAEAPSDVESAKYAISQQLLGMASKLVPGQGVHFEPARSFRVSDAAIAYGVLSNMSVGDRARIEGVTFKRVKSTMVTDNFQNREVDGSAEVTIAKGRGVAGQLGYKLAALFEKWALTAPLGLMLRGWFPHALAEYRNREVLIGDAQATRMKEVMIHEIGHQVQFGTSLDPNQIKEWSKLSGWTDGSGAVATGLGADGRLMGFDPSVKPGRSDNFVYEDFTEDLDPKKVAIAAASIEDPELKAEFLQTAKIKRNMREAIKETFGVDAKGYSMTSPLEDYAESYRAFYQDTELLVRKAPDKFLFLNAQSQRYTPEQVQVFFERSGKDAKAVATKLAETGLTQDTIDRIFKANGLQADTQQLAAAAAQQLEGGAELPAFRKAFLELQKRVGERDLTFVTTFQKDPAKALGAVWDQLSEAEKGQFASDAQRVEIVQKMQQGLMSYASGAAQGLKQMEVASIQGLAQKFLDGEFLKGLNADPAQALAAVPGFADLPAKLKAAFEAPKTRGDVQKFANALSTLVSADRMWLVGSGDLRAKMMDTLKTWNEDSLDGAIALLGQDPEKAAKVFAGLETTGASSHAPGN